MDLVANWTWARFGLSDAADLLVFISGYAAAIAFGATFRRSGFAIGTARVAQRCGQLYAAHLGLFIALAAVCAAGNRLFAEPDYIGRLNLYPFFVGTQKALVRLCGQHSLAVFLFSSMALAWVCGVALDQLERDVPIITAANAVGLATIIAFAHGVA